LILLLPLGFTCGSRTATLDAAGDERPVEKAQDEQDEDQ
jgi:hypothetical protein